MKVAAKTTAAPSAPALGRAPMLRQASFDDYPQIAALEARYGLKSKPEQEWRALWLGNPAFERAAGGWPLGWVLETEGGRIVGTISNIPLVYWFRGRELSVATSHAWIGEERYRAFSPLLLHKFFSQRGVDLYLCSTINSQSAAAVSSFGTRRVPSGAWDRAAFWITSYAGFAAAALRLKRVRFAGALRYPCALALWARDRIVERSNGWSAGPDAAGRVEVSSQFDSRFDPFWERLKQRSADRLLGERSRQWLDWHFGTALAGGQARILTLESGGALAAYAVFCRKDEPGLGLKRLRLVDFQSLTGNASPVLPILERAARQCREEGIHALEVVGWRLNEGELIDRAAPHKRVLGAWLFGYKVGDVELVAELAEAACWDASSFDGDASL